MSSDRSICTIPCNASAPYKSLTASTLLVHDDQLINTQMYH
jgi:hypothetical protein